MAQSVGLNRRSFLKHAGITAVAGAVGRAAPLDAHGHSPDAPGVIDTANGRFDFDTPYSRIGTDCTKWDRQIALYGKDHIDVGMGIADLDFKAAPCITKALQARLQHENWGYLSTPQSYAEAIVKWQKRRHNLEIKPEWIIHSPSVHPGILSALRVFSPPGSKVLMQAPVYDAFYTDIARAGCQAEESPLKLVNGRYQMDFEDLERRIDHDTHVMILCNPQNPTGNVWSREDLMRVGEICTRRRVVVLSDEVHSDFVMKGQRYTPFASLENDAVVMNSITFNSPGKSFNLPAMKVAYMFSRNPAYLDRIRRGGHIEGLNTLGVVAQHAAYMEGDDWLDQLVPYIDGNHDFVESYLAANVPLIKHVKPAGTYLTWIDVSALSKKIDAQAQADAAMKAKPGTKVTAEDVVGRYLVDHAKVHMNSGSNYGLGGQGRMRMNIGTSRKTLELALSNMAHALKNV